jgi:hypothetical protein
MTGSSHKNLLIGTHNVIARLDGYLETSEINGRTAYRWKPKNDSAAKEARPGGTDNGGQIVKAKDSGFQ